MNARPMTPMNPPAKPSTETRAQAITRLIAHIEDTLADLVPRDARLALLDFPDYDNIGDSAIYVGELAYLDSRGLKPSYVSLRNQPEAQDARIADIVGDGPILLQGGGNFGDLWPWFQPYRERILTKYPGHPIVQFPQTLHFSSPQALGETARIIERHGAFTLLVRDQRSFDLATRHFQCEVRLCPDMAFCMGPLSKAEPTKELLLHLRKDQEAAAPHDVSKLVGHASVLQSDWPHQPDDFNRRIKWETLLIAAATGRIFENRHSLKERYFRRQATKRLARGTSLLSSARTVVTDRLHGHILCFLMDLPHVVLDNSYGKTSGFMQAWQTTAGSTYTAHSLDEAVALLKAHEGLALEAA
ncbi:MAG: hypothetical protein JWP52_8 [Rhizobacter sp.]|nr:hypothetical protein [Rhizobacter sp.]